MLYGDGRPLPRTEVEVTHEPARNAGRHEVRDLGPERRVRQQRPVAFFDDFRNTLPVAGEKEVKDVRVLIDDVEHAGEDVGIDRPAVERLSVRVTLCKVDVAGEIRRLTGSGADVAIEALGAQATFESALRVLRPGGTLSSLGVYSGKLQVPYDAFAAGLGDHRIVTTLCPGGKERMRRLIEMVRHGRLDLRPLLTHRFRLDDINAAYALFGSRGDGVMKVAITP
jgi:threonine dehydrogenase-like Zn-dependent dehydrogenase